MLSNHQHPTIRQHGKELKWNGRGQPGLRKKQLAKTTRKKRCKTRHHFGKAACRPFRAPQSGFQEAKWFSESKVVFRKLTVRSGCSRKPLAVPGNFSFEQALSERACWSLLPGGFWRAFSIELLASSGPTKNELAPLDYSITARMSDSLRIRYS